MVSNPYAGGGLKISAILADVSVNGGDAIIPTDTSGDVYYYTSQVSTATPVKDTARSKTGSNSSENGLYASSALSIKVEKTDEGEVSLKELLAAAGSEAYKITVTEDETSALRITFTASRKYNPNSGDNVYAFTAATLLTAINADGDYDNEDEYTWSSGQTVYLTLNGGTSSTQYSANTVPASSYTIEAIAASNA